MPLFGVRPRPKFSGGVTCHGCGGMIRYRHGADIFCGKDCREGYAKIEIDIAARLTKEGFEQDPEFAKSFTKDGIALNVRYCAVHGIEEALRDHRAAVLHYVGKNAVGAAPAGQSDNSPASGPSGNGA